MKSNKTQLQKKKKKNRFYVWLKSYQNNNQPKTSVIVNAKKINI